MIITCRSAFQSVIGGKKKKNCLPEIKNYDQKNYCSYKYWSDDKGVVLKDSPFVYREQVGITKNDNSSDGKDAFFKQTLISLMME